MKFQLVYSVRHGGLIFFDYGQDLIHDYDKIIFYV